MINSFFGFLISLCLGSFYVTLIVRVFRFFYGQERKNKTFLQKLKKTLLAPSHCDFCKKQISNLALVPVLGYFFTFGKCQNCQHKISFFYLLGELSFGIVFLLIFCISKHTVLALFFTCLYGHLLLSACTDYKFFSLDYENLVFIFIFGFLCLTIIEPTFPSKIDFYVLGGFFIFYFIIWYFFPKSMGLGDVIFSPFFAFLCGHPFWLLYLNSSYFTALCVSFAIRDRKKSFRKMVIPMGTYFAFALFCTFIVRIYLKFEVF